MPDRFGQGRGFGRGSGGGRGFGFRGSSPPMPYTGRGRGGLPRCGYYLAGAPASSFYRPQSSAAGTPGASGIPPYSPMSREDELRYMKEQADAVKEQLERIESRMRDLETKE